MSQFYADQSDRINDSIRSLNARDFDSLEQLKEVYNDNILTKSAEKIQDFTDKWTNIQGLAEKEIIGIASFGGIVKGGKNLLSTIKAIKSARQTRATGGNVGEDAPEDSLDVDDGPKPEDFEPTEEDISRGDDEASFDPTEDDIADASKSSAENAVEDTTNAVEDTAEDMFSTSSFSAPEDAVDQASGFTRDLDFENAMENLDPSSMSTEDLQSAYDEFDSYLDQRDRSVNPRETPPDDGNADVDNFSSETEGAQNSSATDNFSAEQTAENTTQDSIETGGDSIADTVGSTSTVGDVGSTVADVGSTVSGEVAGQLGGDVGSAVGGELGGSLVGELVGGLSLSAIPVIGEVALIATGIATAITSIAELFEKPKRATVAPPDPSISNLDLQSQLSSKYSNATPSMDSLDKVGGSSSF